MPKKEEFLEKLENNNIEVETKIDKVLTDSENELKVNSKTTAKAESKENVETKGNEDVVKNEVDEETVIDKIKSFLAKIAQMQQEAKKEILEKKEKDSSNENEEKTEEPEKPKYMLEYYDLPYRYNETVVKVLAQTPKKLFVYWDISDSDREKYLKAFGDDFFYKTYPVLLLYNEDKKYVREIPVNDFANSWYIDIQDAKTKYSIQLGRKFRNKPEIVNFAEFEQNRIILQTDYLPFANSNQMEAPNDHVLFESMPNFITFRNVKTNEETSRELRSFKDSLGNNYDVKEFYENAYKDELADGMFDMSNPSSGLSSSSFK